MRDDERVFIIHHCFLGTIPFMRILVITPWVPYPISGADQQDRFQGFLQLQELGHDIHVLAKVHAFQDQHAIKQFYADRGISLELIPYVSSLSRLLLRRLPRLIVEPALLDGAALEYTDARTEDVIHRTVLSFHPDVAWVEFSFLWPVVKQLHGLGVPSVLRSANNEAQQSIDEHGGSIIARILAIPKIRSEKLAAKLADVLLAITPNEEQWYRACGSRTVDVLPLRGLPMTLRRRTHHDKSPLDVVFLSSSYSNGHNRDALGFLLTEVIPRVQKMAPDQFRFHITGQKFPESFRSHVTSGITVHGFIPDLHTFLDSMDIALCPSVTGQGMQQKIFEPLCCGLPLITHHTAGYPFEHGRHVLFAHDAQTYAEQLLALRSTERRQELADAAHDLAQTLFSEKAIVDVIVNALALAGSRI